jgi:hypothetical protein
MKCASWIVTAALALTSTTAHAALAPEVQAVIETHTTEATSEVEMKIEVELRTGVFAYTLLGSAESEFLWPGKQRPDSQLPGQRL